MNSAKNEIWGELRSRWAVLLAMVICCCTTATQLFAYLSGVFVVPLQEEFGWSRTMISGAGTVFGLLLALSSPFFGALTDRYSAKVLIPVSLGITAAVFVGLSLMPPSYGYFVAMHGIIGALGTGASSLVISRVLTTAFDRARGTALGIGLAGGALVSTFGPHALSDIVVDHGWRTGYLALAAFVLFCAPLVTFILWLDGRRPQSADVTPVATVVQSGGVSVILRMPIFWKLFSAFGLMQMAVPGAVAHFIPMLRDRGLTASSAAAGAGLIGAAMFIARLAVGVIVDRVSATRVAATISLLGAAGVATLVTGEAWSAPVGAIALGMLFGAESDLAAYLASRYFPPTQFGRALGMLIVVMTLAAVGSTLLYGIAVDLTGAYTSMQVFSVFAIAAASGLFLSLPPLRTPQADVKAVPVHA